MSDIKKESLLAYFFDELKGEDKKRVQKALDEDMGLRSEFNELELISNQLQENFRGHQNYHLSLSQKLKVLTHAEQLDVHWIVRFWKKFFGILSRPGIRIIAVAVVLVIVIGPFFRIQFVSHLKKANVKEAKNQISEMAKLLEMFKSECGVYPESLSELVSNDNLSVPCASWSVYMKRVPLDPWRNKFIYQKTSYGYRILSLGSDGEIGGEGDASDVSSDDF